MISRWVIVFDWDGTLIESLPIKIRNAGKLFQEMFTIPPENVEAAYRANSGIPRRQLFDAICLQNGFPALTEEQFSLISGEFTARNLESISKVLVEPVVTSTLVALKEKGYPLFVSTSAAPDEVQLIAKFLKLAAFFQEILGSQGDFTKGPAHIDYIQTCLGVDRSRIWFVGDEPNDILLGKHAGVRTVVKTGSHPMSHLVAAQPDVLIESLSDLIPLLERS